MRLVHVPPPPAKVEPLSESVTISLTPTDAGRVRDAAAAAGLTRSAWGRRALLAALDG